MTEPTKPHDALFKRTFSQELHAAGELRAVLPSGLVKQIDFSTLKLCSGSFVDAALHDSESDLLFSAKVAGKPALLYVLFEHQSEPDELMPLRLLGYILRILDQHLRSLPKGSPLLPLPLVIPVVLHHSERGWSVARRVEDLFDQDLVALAGIAELTPRLSFMLDDLTELSDETLEARQLALEPLLALWALRDARSRKRLEQAIEHWVPLLARLFDSPDGQQALWTLLRYILTVADETAAQTLSRALLTTRPQAKDALMTLAEKWIAEGEARGKAEGKAETLRKLLILKFGELSETASRRLAVASEPDLDRWIERVLSAETLDDVMA
ncbi:MAG TPA: Rpn family recombination-promoting nuclease/putative transposase [Polyangiaceae bacterium]|nr:Rpn family recombination-promoting nuclease/putative transposase [Polyangiaceae bacterium]